MFTRDNYSEETEGERKDCAVRAFSVAACVSYNTAQELFRKHGRETNKGTPGYVTESVLREQFPNAKEMSVRLTIPRFAKTFNEGHYLVHVRKHALAIVDGVVHDWKLRPKTKVWRAWRLV